MYMRLVFARLVLILILAVPMAASAPASAQERVGAGYDLFVTDPTETDLLGIPFRGDAGVRPTFDFVPPPTSADGRRAIADTDTIVHRLEEASVDALPGTADPITIELVLLRLVSSIEMDVDGDGLLDGPVYVTLQKDRRPAGETRLDYDVPLPAEGEMPPPPGPVVETVLPGPRSFGEMTITFDSAGGGTFDSRLEIYADLRIGDRDGPIVCGEAAGLPPCADLDAGLLLESSDAPWSRDAVPESITIRGINYSLAAPDRNTPLDFSRDFWAGVQPMAGQTICLRHGGHPDPGGLPTAHNTCRTSCTTEAIGLTSCRNDRDDDCNGTIDDCDEDVFGPTVVAPGHLTFECAQSRPNLDPDATGFATGTDNCFPPALPPGSIRYDDFETPGCGLTFLVDRIWTATDDCGNEASMPDLQQLRVVDTTPPEITCPVDTVILWNEDAGPANQGSAGGSDQCSQDLAVEVGFSDQTTPGVCRSREIDRTWTATDPCGLSTPCGQRISVRGPKDAIDDLNALLASLGLPRGIETALSATLQGGVANVCANRARPAANQLGAFIQQVGAQSPMRISAADAARLIAAAQAVIAALDDPENGGACPDGCGDHGDDGGGDGGDGDGDGDGDDNGNGGNDGDGDGVDDDVDACPDSDTAPTLVIDGCDTGVDNLVLADGCTLADRIAACADGAANHGGFVRCVVDLEGELVAAGLISRRERSAIQRCAARADLP